MASALLSTHLILTLRFSSARTGMPNMDGQMILVNRIAQLSFQVVRTSDEGARELGETLYNIALRLKNIMSEEPEVTQQS